MKKNITRIMLTALSVVLTVALVAGLSSCSLFGAKGPKAYTAAEESWNAATTKKVVDEISVVATTNLGNFIGTNVQLEVNIELTREYKGSEIDTFSGVINKVKISGLSQTIGSALSLVKSYITIPADVENALKQGNIELSEDDVLEGAITIEDGNYVVTATANVELFALDFDTEDLDEPISVPSEDVDSILEDLGLEIDFDMPTIYDFDSAAITKDNKATFSGEAGLDSWISQILALGETFFSDELVVGDETVTVPPEVITILQTLVGSTDVDDIKEYLIGDEGLIDLGDVNMEFTYDGKNFKTITGTQNVGFSITKNQIEQVLNIGFIKTALEGMNFDPEDIVGLVFDSVGVPSPLEADITVSFTSTFTY